MIERLHSSLRTLVALSPGELGAPGTEAVLRDCADALRLQLDCPQGELGASERETLVHLSDLLESSSVRAVDLATAIRAALTVLDPTARIPATDAVGEIGGMVVRHRPGLGGAG